MNTQIKNKKWKNIAMSILFVGSIGIVPLIATSCSNATSTTTVVNENLLTIQNKYEQYESQYLTKNSAKLPIFGYSDPKSSFDSLITNAENAINALQNYKNNHSLSQDEIIWIDSYIFKWELKIQNIRSGMVYLGANPITGTRILSSSSNHISDIVKSAINIYPLNPETGDPDTSAAPDAELVNNLASSMDDATSSINDFKQMLKYGQETYGYQPSTIAKKILINQFLNFFYQNELNTFADDTSANYAIKIAQLINYPNTPKNYFSDLLTTIDTLSLSDKQKNEIKTSCANLEVALDNFVEWYSNDYYIDVNSFGPVNDTNPIILQKTNNFGGNDAEHEKTIIAGKSNTKIYGVGLSTNNLQEKNIGIGFMKLKGGANNPFASGNEVYQQLLMNNNSINTSAVDIYKKGIELTNDALTKMTNIAKQVKDIVIDGIADNTNIWYDNDGIGPNQSAQVTLGSINNSSSIGNTDQKIFKQFNIWLNQEDFFWGREHLDGDKLTQFINDYWTNPKDEQIASYKNVIITQGYQTNWEGKNTINGEATGTVTGNQALAGAVLSLKDYIDFKTSTDSTYNPNFNPIKDYVISPYNYDIRVDIGVGMEGPRGSCQFQYNCDPYYSLPKWSVSSLTTHEGKMGHHTQQEYWTEYLKGGNGSTGEGPGYTFINDAFHEGWAVFTEWFANELQIYGTQLDETTRMPTNWTVANGLVPDYDANNSGLETQMKELHGGVYYNKAIGADGSEDKLQNSIKLANMLQYYGFLNEAQLRNMRLCLDTAYHYKMESDDSSAENSSLPFGASIKEVRDYMTQNSALSIGDINSESIRYLVMPSQATGYMLGKIIFEDLYNAVAKSKDMTIDEFINDKAEVRKLFDLMLRNGEIPLEVLKEQVYETYNISATVKRVVNHSSNVVVTQQFMIEWIQKQINATQN